GVGGGWAAGRGGDGEGQVGDEAGDQADHPGVVVQGLEEGDHAVRREGACSRVRVGAAYGQDGPDQSGDDGSPVPAGGVPVTAAGEVEVGQEKVGAVHEPVAGDQYAGHRCQQSAVVGQPDED